jgi:ATP-binding cassette subfamily B protein
MTNKNKKENIDLTQFQHRPLAFWFFVMRQKKWFGVAAVFCVVIATSLGVITNVVIKKIVNDINLFGDDVQIVLPLMTIVGISVVMNVLYRSSGWLAAWWITHMELYASQISFSYLINHSSSYFANRLSGKLQNKIFNISWAMDSLTGITLWNFLSLGIKLLVFLYLAFSVHWLIAFVMIAMLSLIFLFSAFMSSKLIKSSERFAEELSTAKGLVVDIVGNILATKQNVALKREIQNTTKTLAHYQRVHFKVWRFYDLVLLFSNFLAISLVAVVLAMSTYLWQVGLITIGDVIMFLTITLSLYGNLESLSDNVNRFMENTGKLQEGLKEVFAPHEIQDLPGAKKVKIKKGEIVFDKVNFHYEDDKKNTVFKNLSLTIPAGQKIGLVGESGAGKSTFVSLLLRFMDVESGLIQIDGHTVSKIRQDDLRSAIAYVPQDALLFHRSLLDNIKYSYPRATQKEVEQASKRAHALEFINSFPKGFKTLVGERGVKLSGGQKQRVMIARAMLKKSPILVLDEATSALDSKAEQKIQEALESLMKGRTTIAIAHRLSTLKQMDRIIVFEGGRIIEDGTHNELLKLKGKYWELWQHQS